MVEDAPSEEEVMPKILKFIGNYPIVAHNAIFDYSFLNEAKLRVTGEELTNPRIDTQSMFKEIAPELESHGLEALTQRFNVELNNHHRAMADTMGLARTEYANFPYIVTVFKNCFNFFREDFFAALQNNHIFNTSRNIYMTVIVNFRDVACVEPAVFIYDFSRHFRLIVITLHNRRASEQ